MTDSTKNRIRRLYVEWVGYDPIAEGDTPQAALRILKEYREAMRAN